MKSWSPRTFPRSSSSNADASTSGTPGPPDHRTTQRTAGADTGRLDPLTIDGMTTMVPVDGAGCRACSVGAAGSECGGPPVVVGAAEFGGESVDGGRRSRSTG